jgi:ADP-ribose pyrophosphatase YjhB (NUDIX family)
MREKKHCHYCGNGLSRKFVEGADRLFCEQCKEPLYENPLPASCLVVVDSADRALLVKRSVEPKKGFWCLPGGFMELGETPEQAALRELKEETGLTGQIEMLLGVSANPSGLYHTVLMVGYLVKSYTGTPVAGDDAMDVAFVDYDHLPEIAFESHLNFIRIYYAGYTS